MRNLGQNSVPAAVDSLDDSNPQNQPLGAKKEFPKLIMGRRYPRGKIESPTVCKMGAPNLALESCVGFISYPKLVKTPEMLILLFLSQKYLNRNLPHSDALNPDYLP